MYVQAARGLPTVAAGGNAVAISVRVARRLLLHVEVIAALRRVEVVVALCVVPGLVALRRVLRLEVDEL